MGRSQISLLWTGAALAIAAATAGCRGSADRDASLMDRKAEGQENEAVVRLLFDHARQNAVAVDAAVYPYHFAPGEATLNELGEQRVEDLAVTYRRAPGPVNVARGNAAQELYQARVQGVLDRLSAAGVDVRGVAVGEELSAGGPGISSARAAQLWQRAEEGGATEGSTKSGEAGAAAPRSTAGTGASGR